MKKDSRTYRVQFRATREEREVLFNSAKQRGQTVSQYIRDISTSTTI